MYEQDPDARSDGRTHALTPNKIRDGYIELTARVLDKNDSCNK